MCRSYRARPPRRTSATSNLPPRLFKELGTHPRPSRLMARAQSHSGVPVKIFVKQNQIAPQGIVLKFIVAAIHRPMAVFVAQKNVRQRSGQHRAHIPERYLLARASRELHAKI